jgi:hypothetical protein
MPCILVAVTLFVWLISFTHGIRNYNQPFLTMLKHGEGGLNKSQQECVANECTLIRSEGIGAIIPTY